jgi:hypothetical protein
MYRNAWGGEGGGSENARVYTKESFRYFDISYFAYTVGCLLFSVT